MSVTNSGSDTDELSGIDEPTLLEKFKRILDQYRNDVQIIKELVQNADDAKATKMKVLYEGRAVNTKEENENPSRKFLRGPALAFFNDAQFTEKDWKGIKSINKSIKKDDPLKTGQFGLGFKSVFHLTDYPCVISGDRVLMIDPQEENESHICTTVKLRKIRKAKKHDMKDYLNALEGVFGFSKNSLNDGFNEGTLFWFPLRQAPSKLSDDIYCQKQLNELLQTFLNEAHRSLLFLKTLCSIELYVNLNEVDAVPVSKKRKTKTFKFMPELENINFGKDIPGYRVQIENKSHNLICKRNSHLKVMETLVVTGTEKTHHWVDDIEITTERKCKTSSGKIEKSRWLLVNYLKGGELSHTTKDLMNIDNYRTSHLTGFAAFIDEKGIYTNADGHIFCYQPLPEDQEHTTGLPVHINGFFALTQDRRHIRWPDKDDTAHENMEKKIQWNLVLANEIMPDGYYTLIQEMVNLCKAEKNPEFMVNAVYYTLPDTQRVQKQWKNMSCNVIAKCKELEIVFTKNDGGKWIRPYEAVFVNFQNHTNTDAIVKLLLREKIDIVIVPEFVLNAFKGCDWFSELQFLTPVFLKNHLSRRHGYKALQSHEKENILQFLLQKSATENIDQLELLPLANGSFTIFSKNSNAFLESEDIIDLFPEHGGMFVSPLISQVTRTLLQSLLEKHTDTLGIKALSHVACVSLIEKTLKYKLGLQCVGSIEINASAINKHEKWLQQIWDLIQTRFSEEMHFFSGHPIFPVYEGLEKNTKLSFHSLNTPMLQISSLVGRKDKYIVLSALKLLSITCFRIIPKWIYHERIKEYIHTETSESLEKLFSKVNDESVTTFNRQTSSKTSSALLRYLSGGLGCQRQLCDELKSKLQTLKLFEVQFSSEESGLVSLKENNRIYTGNKFPSRFIERTIVLHSETEIAFAKYIHGNFLSDLSVVGQAVANVQNYNDSDRQNLLNWVIRKRIYISDGNIRKLLSETKFLKTENGSIHEPQELFDPSDETLSCLFKNQNMTPVVDVKDKKYVDGLRKLGLKSRENLNSTDIVKTCNIVHEMSEGKVPLDERKCKCLLDIMNDKSDLVDPTLLNKKRCIYMEKFYQQRHSRHLPQKLLKPFSQLCYPTEVKSIDYAPLVSSEKGLMECDLFPNLSRVFHWTEPPGIEIVIRQLLKVVQIYKSNLKSEILPIITAIYEWLRDQSNVHGIKGTLIDVFSLHGSRFIWSGNGFQAPDSIYTNSTEEDIDMRPFVNNLPDELHHLSTFFIQLGCHKSQSLEMYIRTLHDIRMTFENNTTRSASFKKDGLRIIIRILKRISQDYFNELILCEADLYFPVVCQDRDDIILKPVKECTFCDADWLRDSEVEKESGIFYVHPDVPNTTAEKLGATSLTRQMLKDTEAFEEWGQEESLTRRLKNLLKDSYTDGFSIAKELLQNADDAKAKKFWLLFDERENTDAKSHLLSEGMAEFQGPAIWVYNEAKFSPEDLKNITQIYGETKKHDASKIGKFGLGFCAVYNITDVPSFVTGSDFVIFDPHTTFLGSSLPGRRPGLKISLTHTLVKRFRNQFKPFEGIFGCNLMTKVPYFDGTLFRLPLRIKKSDISNKLYSPSKVDKLFKKIMDLSANMLIFNQNIQEIKLFHIPKSENDPTKNQVCFELSKSISYVKRNSEFQDSIVAEVAKRKAKKSLKKNPLKILCKVEITGKGHKDSFLSKDKKKKTKDFVGTWLVSWSTCTDDKSIDVSDQEKGALPLGGVAVPIELDKKSNITIIPLDQLDSHFYKLGHLFFFLPLPIQHDFPFHINSQFSVTSDRRHLEGNNEDDLDLERKDWNEAMLKDSITHALLYFLENVHQIENLVNYKFTQLWPRDQSAIPLRSLSASFYTKIVECKEIKLFEKNGQWFDISMCVFLEKEFRSSSVGNIAFEILSMMINHVVDVPEDVYNLLYRANKDSILLKTVTRKSFYLEYFLPRLNDFRTDQLKDKRNELLLHAIKLREGSIDAWLKNNPCIPSCPYGMLKRPAEMIDPNCQLANLFESSDIVFPEEIFVRKSVIPFLHGLGLIHEMLTDGMVLERARSITISKCNTCALERSGYLILYLSKNATNHQDVLVKLKDIEFLPTKSKPDNWPFRWYSEDTLKFKQLNKCPKHVHQKKKKHHVSFTCAKMMFYNDCTNLVGSLKYVFAADAFCSKIDFNKHNVEAMKRALQLIGMEHISKEDVSYQIVTQQLLSISTFWNGCESKAYCKGNIPSLVIEDIYQHLDSCCQRGLDILEYIRKHLGSFEVVWIENYFVSPSNVVIEGVIQNCKPYLFKLNDSPLKRYKHLMECLKIRKVFKPQHIARSLQNIMHMKKHSCLTEMEVQTVINMLHSLKFSLFYEKIHDIGIIFDDDLTAIYGPDTKCIMRDMKHMCFNDFLSNVKSSSMIYCHNLIPKALAEVFGVMSKKVHLLEEDAEDVEDFGQAEPLEVRLQRIVENYPCDSGILKELIQNADDANATEIHFLKDFVTHPDKHILDKSFAPLQGPALCVYNDSSFTKADLDGIKRLGVGSKSRDPSKTGRYGVGFNAVYNLTDVPSLYSRGLELENGETLFFFDPVARYIPKVKKTVPGKRYKNVQLIRDYEPDVMLGYHESFFMENRNRTGSVFRFPLRSEEMAKHSTIKKDATSMNNLSEILDSFRNEMKDVLLFLKNVRTIKVSSFDMDYKEEFVIHVHMTKSEEKKRKDFFSTNFSAFRCSTLENCNLWGQILQTQQKHVLYELEIQETTHIVRKKTTYGMEKTKKNVLKGTIKNRANLKHNTVKENTERKMKYIVVQTIGFRDIDDVPHIVHQKCQNGDIDLIPYGGVALSAGTQLESYENILSQSKSNVFCFLPLPVKTGLPFHIHGYFSLDHEIRRGLWKAEDAKVCGKTLWNLAIIEQVITHAYIILVEYMKGRMFKTVTNVSQFDKVMGILNNFQTLFPDREKIDDFYWQHLLKSIYKTMVSEEISFLPVVKTTKMNTSSIFSRRQAILSWTALKYRGYSFNAFNSIENNESEFNSILGSLGMRITTVSKHIKESMKFSDVKINSLQPVHVIEFLCSVNSSSLDKCKVITNKTVAQTDFRSMETLLKVAEYCLQDVEKFIENIKFLPLMMTQDFIVHTLQDQEVLFLEETGISFNLFPSKRSRFLHEEVSKIIQTKVTNYQLITDDACRKFKLEDLANFVSETCQLEKDGSAILSWNKENPSADWIQQFWRLFFHLLPLSDNQKDDVVENDLKIVQELPVIPAVKIDTEEETFLVKPLHRKNLIDIESFSKNGKLHKALRGLQLLEIDGNMIQGTHVDESFTMLKCLLNQIPTFDKAEEVVQCLHLNLNKVSYAQISLHDATRILKYFDEYLGSETSIEIFEILAEIPIFVSNFNELSALKGYKRICVAPPELPGYGLEDIAKHASTLLLRDVGTNMIFAKLNIQKLKLSAVYKDLIIPHIEYVDDESLYEHLKFLANVNENNPDEVFPLLDLLRITPVIYLEESKRRVKISELFDPKKKIFKTFCPSLGLLLLPAGFKKHSFVNFFQSLGLKSHMSGPLFVQFAKYIETKGAAKGIEMELKKKSVLLLKHFFLMESTFFDKTCFDEFAKIKFIAPDSPVESLSDIYEFHNAHQFICFEGSVLASSKHTCWTVSNILPHKADPTVQCLTYKGDLVQKLRIFKKPNLKHLVKHCKNISVRVYENTKKLPKSKVSILQSVMGEIYEELCAYLKSGELEKQHAGELLGSRVVFVQKIQQMVLPEMIVMSCKEDEEICPFLNKCPDEYIQYKDLFLFLGASRETSCDSFASVLYFLRNSGEGSNIVLPQERFDAIKATKLFFNYLAQESKEVEIKGKHNVMLSENYTLEYSRNLVVKNNSYYQKQLRKVNYNKCLFLIELESLNEPRFKLDTFVDSLRYIPSQNKPHLLTDIVRERVVLRNIVDKDSRTSRQLEDFIHCRSFIDGFMRLVRHSWRTEGRNWTSEEENRLVKHLVNIQFRHASGIETLLAIQPIKNGELQTEQLVENTNEAKSVHLECNESNMCVYFDSYDYSWFETIQTELAIHLNGIVEKCLKDQHLMQLRHIIGMKDVPGKISLYLSKEKVEEYDSSADIPETEIYPKPGTFVPRELYVYLDNDYNEIYDYEYKCVALEIEDPVLSDCTERDEDEDDNAEMNQDPIYIFVHVVKKLEPETNVPLMQEYEINDGTENFLRVKAYQLYKFIRKTKTHCDMEMQTMQLVIYSRNSHTDGGKRTQTMSLETAYKEIRMTLTEAWRQSEREKSKIVKRLLLKWHPDKNPDKVKFCTKVFQYIQQCIKRLEKGMPLIDDDSDEDEENDFSAGTTRGFPSRSSNTFWSSSRFGRFWERHERRRTFYEDEHRRRSQESGTEHKPSGTAFTMPETKPFHYHAEARRWQKQAKSDLHNSTLSYQKTPSISYNWVCYMAHQAAEKSLKAAWYSKDADKIYTVRFSHDLNRLASDLGPDINTRARDLVSLTGAHTRMRYPDAIQGQQIPEEIFDKQTAESVVSYATEIIEIVQGRFIQ